MENKEVYCNLNNIVKKLKSTNDPKKKYEYILWLGKKLPSPNNEILIPENKVKGCVSEVYVKGTIKEGKIYSYFLLGSFVDFSFLTILFKLL